MATGWTEIITAAMVIIDDIRWREDLAVNPAVFYREKAEWVKKALASLNRPPELGDYLQKTMVAPSWADATWTSTPASTGEETTVSTGKKGYDLCCVCAYTQNKQKLIPYTEFTYDPDTGNVVFAEQDSAGVVYTIDFYSDGTFGTDTGGLTIRQMDVFSLALAVVWDQRMDRNWLNLQAKVHDSSFSTPSEGTYAEKINQRLMRNIQLLNDKMSKYEQDCAYRNRFRGGAQNTTLI